MQTKYSVVVPLKNEEENIEELVKEIKHTMEQLDTEWELICVDDGSTDNTLAKLVALRKHNPFMRILSFDRNYGQSSAFDAGFKQAQGEWVITMDGDRQNDPADIPKLLAMAETHDLVCGCRIKRKDVWHKRAISKLANFVRSRVCKDQVSDTGCSLKVYRRSCLKSIKMYKGMHRFLPALFKIEGFRVGEMPVNHRERVRGTTKYNFFNRSFNTIADMLAVRWMWKRRVHYRIQDGTLSAHLFLVCGERSGDLHGSTLVKALISKSKNLHLSGVAGPQMRREGVVPFLEMERFEVMGFSDVLAALPRLFRYFYKIRKHVMQQKPEAVVLIDFPGFNLRLAKTLRKSGYKGKIIQYISPTVWAWGRKRIETMSQSLDLLLSIYPFETKFLNSLNTCYVGNPIVEYVQKHQYDHRWKEKLKIPVSKRLIALFPGSRGGEVKRNLPIMLEAAAQYREKYPDALFAISSLHADVAKILEAKQFSSSLREAFVLIPSEYNYELMHEARSALAKSGTVCLELALHGIPTVVVYQLSSLNRFIAKRFLKLSLPYYCIVNILSEKQVYPELIEEKLTVAKLLQQLQLIDNNESVRQTCTAACADLAQHLGNSTAGAAAADQIVRLLQ